MLGSRLNEPKDIARTSYAVRHHPRTDDWLEITSANIDELVRTKLPPLSIQQENLMKWGAAQAGDDSLGDIKVDSGENLSAIIGALNGSRVGALLNIMFDQGVLQKRRDGVFRITHKGWQSLEEKPRKEVKDMEQIDESCVLENNDKKMKAHCNICHGDKSSFIRGEHTVLKDTEGIQVVILNYSRVLWM